MINKLEKILGFKLEETGNISFGDYTSNIAMARAKEEGKKPIELAEESIKRLYKDKELSQLIEKIEIAGPGFINFWLKNDALLNNLIHISREKEKYGNNEIYKSKTAIVEYSSANIAKPFTIGHLRSTIIGDAIANLLEASGYKVLRDNHLGDWGTQFGKQICAIKKWGDMEVISKSENPVKELVELYVKFHEEAEKTPELDDEARLWFKKLEDGDAEAREIWKKCIDWSFREFDRIYHILGIRFSKEFENGRGLGESFFENRMAPVIEELKQKQLLSEGNGGAKLVFFENEKYPPAMILKKDGATLYHTRDLATDKYRLDKFNPDLIINEVGMEQKLYFQQLFEIEKMLEWFREGQRIHIAHGLVRFKEGKMSTRKGNVIWMQEVLDEAVARAKKLGADTEETAKTVAIGALKYNDLKRDPKTEIVFDWDEILNMEGNSGPYLQYTVARCKSVLAKANAKDGGRYGELNLKALTEAESIVARALIHFRETVQKAAESYSPNLLCNYLYELAKNYNSFYNAEKIIGSDREKAGILITDATAQVLTNGLNLLGIKVPAKM
jgi:arginyl-tRNA synthetase